MSANGASNIVTTRRDAFSRITAAASAVGSSRSTRGWPFRREASSAATAFCHAADPVARLRAASACARSAKRAIHMKTCSPPRTGRRGKVFGVCVARHLRHGGRRPACQRCGSVACCTRWRHSALCRVVDLRPYALHAQRADIFATLFEREFIQAQEAAGITVIGQFRNPDDPDRFVWLRGFRDMASRATALQAFYDSALWKPPRDEANANSPTPTTCCCPSRANDAGEFS